MFDWDRFVADHGPPSLRLACRILGHGPDAEDAVQEAFLQVYLIGQNEEVTSWGGLLHRAVLHRSLDRLRRRRASGPLADEPAQPRRRSPGGRRRPRIGRPPAAGRWPPAATTGGRFLYALF